MSTTEERSQTSICSSERNWCDLKNQATSPFKSSIANPGESLKNSEIKALVTKKVLS